MNSSNEAMDENLSSAMVAAALTEADWSWQPEVSVPAPAEYMRPILESALRTGYDVPEKVSSLYAVEQMSGGNVRLKLRNGPWLTFNRDDARLIGFALLGHSGRRFTRDVG